MKTFLHSSKDKQSLSNWSLRQKAGFFVFLALFAICIGMACFFNGFSLPNLLILIAIAIVSMAIYVLPISLHPVVKAVITIILPTAAFFLLESMTHVVWETMEIDAVLLNLVFYYLFFLFFFFVSGSTKISLDILLIFTMIVGLANYFVILFRSSPMPAQPYTTPNSLPLGLFCPRTAFPAQAFSRRVSPVQEKPALINTK